MIRRGGAALAAALLVAAGAACAGTLADVREKGVLEVAVYDAFAPFSYRDASGRPAGIDVAVARELARRLGVKVDLRFQPADESVDDDLRNAIWKGHYLGGGVADVMLHMPVDPNLARQIDQVTFGGTYFQEEIALAYATDAFDKPPGIAAFVDTPIGVEIETLADGYLLSTMNGELRNSVRHYSNIPKALEALRSGELKAVMGNRAEMQGSLREGDAIAITRPSAPGLRLTSWDLGTAVKATNAELAAAVNEAINAMNDDGTLDRLFAEHGVERLPPSSRKLSERGE